MPSSVSEKSWSWKIVLFFLKKTGISQLSMWQIKIKNCYLVDGFTIWWERMQQLTCTEEWCKYFTNGASSERRMFSFKHTKLLKGLTSGKHGLHLINHCICLQIKFGACIFISICFHPSWFLVIFTTHHYFILK